MENSLLHWLKKAWLYLKALCKWLALAATMVPILGISGGVCSEGRRGGTEARAGWSALP